MKDKDKTRYTAEAKEEDKARYVIVTKMADEAGFVAVVSEEDKVKHLIVAIVAIVTKEVTKTTQLKDLRIYSRMYSISSGEY